MFATISGLYAQDKVLDRKLILQIATNGNQVIWLPGVYEYNEESVKSGEANFYGIGSEVKIKLATADADVALVFSLIGSVREHAKANAEQSPEVILPKEDTRSTRSIPAHSTSSYLILNGIMHCASWTEIDIKNRELTYHDEKITNAFAGYVAVNDKLEKCYAVTFRLSQGRSVIIFLN